MENTIHFIECPRDPMQDWKTFIPTEKKIEYINQLLKVGFDTIDFGSFVSAKAIPQMADTKEVIRNLSMGNINPVWVCETANSLENFKSQFEDNFVSFAKDSSVSLPNGFDVKAFSKRLFYEDGRDFVLKRLDILNA